MKNIEDIIYNTTREIVNVEGKLRIATLFIFCYRHSRELFAELLYCENKETFIKRLNHNYRHFVVDFSIDLTDRNTSNAFYKTLEKCVEKYDSNGFHKALFEGDEYAKVICEIVSVNFDSISFKCKIKEINNQLTLF